MWTRWNFPKTKLSFQILFNLVLWGLWIGLPLFSPVHQEHEVQHPHPHASSEFSEHIIHELLTIIPLFYVITLLLFPYVFRKRGIFIFFISLILTNLFFVFVGFLLKNFLLAFELDSDHDSLLKEVFPLIMVSGIATTYGFLLEYLRTESHIEDLKNEQMKSELSFLRSQISPHFIFNILNSIVYLIRTKSDRKAEEVTIRLSSLMRYMLYDSDQKMILLAKEFEYLKNYIDLQKMRFEGDVKITIKEEGDMASFKIEPMLLIPFVENAVKHGVTYVDNPFIDVFFIINEGVLTFRVLNKKGNLSQEIKDESSGIGMKNVIRRLELLYPNKHIIQIKDELDSFEVYLSIELLDN